MNLLKYQFINAAEGSFNGLLKELVTKVRFYYENTATDEAKNSIPTLNQIQATLQQLSAEIGDDERNYIEEIIQELEEEQFLEDKVIDEIERSLKAVVSSYNIEVELSNFSFELKSTDAVFWMEFFGYKARKESDLTLLMVTEVFRAACYKFNIIFINHSK